LALLAGVLCIGASFLRLGALADFLSKPILVGFLNGIALSIILGQIGKIFGYSITAGGLVPRLIEFVQKLGLTHWPTLAIGLGTYAVLLIVSKLFRQVPAALVAMILAALTVRYFGLDGYGIKTVGELPAGLPHLRFPHFPLSVVPSLLGDAAGLALVTFSSMMLTSRSFASKNKYDVDADPEFAALGAANIASALSQGFAVSGADSRTAMSDATGGRTQFTGLVAAATIASVLLFFTGPLRYIPVAALGAVLVKAAFSLVDLHTLKTIFKLDRQEFALSVFATLGVVAVGAVHAILIAVVLAILRFVRIVSRPMVEVLGTVDDLPGFHSVERHPGAMTINGLLLLRFNSPIVFFNAPYFKRELITAANAAGPSLKWIVLDMLPITSIDTTGLYTVEEVAHILRERDVVLAAAGRQTEWRLWADARQRASQDRKIPIYPTLNEAIRVFSEAVVGPDATKAQSANDI
jgi:MFS superfamily sulfate permease-like transporter